MGFGCSHHSELHGSGWDPKKREQFSALRGSWGDQVDFSLSWLWEVNPKNSEHPQRAAGMGRKEEFLPWRPRAVLRPVVTRDTGFSS